MQLLSVDSRRIHCRFPMWPIPSLCLNVYSVILNSITWRLATHFTIIVLEQQRLFNIFKFTRSGDDICFIIYGFLPTSDTVCGLDLVVIRQHCKLAIVLPSTYQQMICCIVLIIVFSFRQSLRCFSINCTQVSFGQQTDKLV